MLKKIGIVVFALILGLFAKSALASAATDFTNHNAPAQTVYTSEFDKLVLDATIPDNHGQADTLNALTIINIGTATDFNNIVKLKVWSDGGATGFQGWGMDTELGVAVATGTGNLSWYLRGLNATIPVSGLRIFVTMETQSTVASTTYAQMEIPQLIDQNNNGAFDLGDQGVFVASGNDGPTNGNIMNSYQQMIYKATFDNIAPKSIITDPQDGGKITGSSYLIRGLARDAGGSSLQLAQVSLDSGNTWHDAAITSVDNGIYGWEYQWNNITDGAYTLKSKSKDWIGNQEVAGAGINISVNTSVFSAAKSTLSAAPLTLSADGSAKATVTVVAKNTQGALLNNQTVALASSRGNLDSIVAVKSVTESDGIATFSVSSQTAGEAALSASVGGVALGSQVKVTFTAMNKVYTSGDLIKASGASVYYYGADGKRYVFPNEKIYSTWYNDFSTVKTISDSELATIMIGGNVTYRPGVKMIKLQTDPKVYAVDKGEVLRWVETEAVVRELYGADWNKMIDDVDDTMFVNYTVGAAIEKGSDFNVSAVKQGTGSINADKSLNI